MFVVQTVAEIVVLFGSTELGAKGECANGNGGVIETTFGSQLHAAVGINIA
jgi:hypothetical protein